MFWISNYGNLTSRNPEKECMPEYIKEAIEQQFCVKVNVFFIKNNFFIGNENPITLVSPSFFNNEFLFCNPIDKVTEMELYKHDYNNYKNINCIEVFDKPDIEGIKVDCEGVCSNHVLYVKQKYYAKTKIAMILSGSIRMYKEDFLPKYQKFIDKNKSVWIDVYASLNTEENDLTKEFCNYVFPMCCVCEPYVMDLELLRSGALRPENQEYKFIYSSVDDKWPIPPQILRTNEIPEHMISSEYKSVLKPVPIYSNTFNTLSMYFNQNRAFSMINTTYDGVIVYRTDIIAGEFPEEIMGGLEEDCVYFPKKHIYKSGWINSAIVFGTQETMKIFCELYPMIKELIKDHVLHSETLITEHLKKNSIEFITVDYDYELDPKR